MKKILIILTGFLLLTSCEKWLDVNNNPNSATEVKPDNLFGYAVVAWSGNRCGGDSYLPIGFSAQTLATGGSYGWGYAEDRYDLSTFSLGNTWKLYYSTAANNLRLAIKIAEETVPVNNNIIAQCNIIDAFLAYESTMIYGDEPFSEAWDEKINAPAFDPQKKVLEGALGLIDEALGQINQDDPVRITDSDPFYNGDMSKWIKVARSLKFRILMTMVDKMPEKASDIKKLVEEGNMISSVDDNFLFPWLNEPNKGNPKFKLFDKYTSGQNLWIFANKNVFDYMSPVNDPRIPRYFDPGPEAAPDEYKAVETATEADGTFSLISDYLNRQDAPDVIFSYQEQLFFEAEVYARGIGVSKDMAKASELYKQAVEEACLFYEVGPADAEAFAASLDDLTTLSDQEAIDAIHLQQWVDLMDRPLEAWIQWRRSGEAGKEFPTLKLPDGAPAGGLIRRWVYPADELTANPKAPDNLPKIYEKMWFDL